MSRHHLAPKPRHDRYTICVGWDRPLGSFYAQVLDLDFLGPDPEPETSGRVRLKYGSHRLIALLPTALLPAVLRRHQAAGDPVATWLGVDRRITDPAVVVAAVAPYTEIPADLAARLWTDKLTEGYRHR